MTIILIALAVAALTMTLTQSSLFEEVRKRIGHKLVRCPYCAAHWISFFVWCGYSAQNQIEPFDFVINVFATVAISVLPMIAIDYFNTKMDKNAKILHSSRSTL